MRLAVIVGLLEIANALHHLEPDGGTALIILFCLIQDIIALFQRRI